MHKTIKMIIFSMLISTHVIAGDILLPQPERVGHTTLMEALNTRHSDHQFIDKDLSDQDLSNLLWVAYGVNRTDGKRTIPTARNEKDLSIYVFKKDGIFMYHAEEHRLNQISKENALHLFQKQEYMNNVPVVFVYTGQEDYAPMHAGSAYQNVGLYTATNNMGSIVRGMFDKAEVAKVLSLPDEDVIISQAIGWTE